MIHMIAFDSNKNSSGISGSDCFPQIHCSDLIRQELLSHLLHRMILLAQDFQSMLQWQFKCVEKITPEQDCILYATSDNIQDNQQCFMMREVEVWKYASII